MQHISWDVSYAIGHETIDSQHIKLFLFADSLYNLTEQPHPSKKEISQVLQEASDYVKYHFECEEELMKSVNYDNIRAHIKQHRNFTAYVATQIVNFTGGMNVNIKDLYEYITKWLVTHITQEDIKIGGYIKQDEGQTEQI